MKILEAIFNFLYTPFGLLLSGVVVMLIIRWCIRGGIDMSYRITDHGRIKHIFKYMEYDALTEGQHNLVIKYEEFYLKNKYLTENQYDVLEDIFKQAAENI